MQNSTYQPLAISRFLFSNTKMSVIWLVIRLYVGIQWVLSGYGKLTDPAWFGSGAGAKLGGFIQGALKKTSGDHPDVQGWYASFLENVILPHLTFWSHVVTLGEICVGIALVLGLFVGVAAFFGAFMNLNFLLAGTVSINPVLLPLEILLVLAWRIAGRIGLDYFILGIWQKLTKQKK